MIRSFEAMVHFSQPPSWKCFGEGEIERRIICFSPCIQSDTCFALRSQAQRH